MRKLFMFLALVLGAVSCQTEPKGFDVNMGGEQEVLINVSLPEETRADSAEGGITNVIASDKYTIRYIFQVYNAEGKVSKNPVYEYTDDTSVSFPVRLVPGRDYRFVVWADIVNETTKADLYYNTENFPAISLKDGWNAMDETRDAYTVSELVTNFHSGKPITLTLKRPLAKLRVITTDMEELLGLTPVSATVTYSTSHYNTFDALNSVVGDNKISGCEHANYTIKDDYEATNGKVLFTDYFFAQDEVVNFHMSVKMSDGEAVERSFTTDIPVKRNYLTTIKGNILTDGNNIVVNVEEGFDEEIEYPIIDRTEPANNEIWYTTTDGKKAIMYAGEFTANVISNEYYGNRGIVTYNGDITDLTNEAFRNSTNLATVTLPESVTSIGIGAFYGCSNLSSINIPEGVTAIKDSAFHHCRVLEDITLPQSLTEIGPSAFAVCYKLNGITIPNSVTTIDDNAFYHCESLTNINIPEGVSSINYYTFAWCTNLESVTIPDSVTHIGECTFIYCESLTNITIPDSVISIGDSPFGMCPNIKKFEGKGACDNGLSLIFDNSLYAFAVGSDIEVYTVPNNVKKIKWAVFAGAHLKQITLPEGLTDIDLFAFAHNSSLTSIIVPSSVKTIGTRAFYNCPNLENVYNYSYTPQVADIDVFLDCSDNLKIYVPHQSLDAYKSAEGWREYADKIFGCPPADEIWYTSTNGQIVTPNSSASFGANIISNTYENGRGVIKFDGVVTEIGYSAFWFESNLKSILIPNSVAKIGSTAFVQCDNLVEIYIPDSVTDISDAAFALCDNLTTVTIGDGVEYIHREAFAQCPNLTTLTIGKNTKEIGYSIVAHCKEGLKIYCKAVTPPTLGSLGLNNMTIYVPAESYWDYISAEDWAYHKDCIVAYDFENNCVVATPAPTKPASNEIWYTNGSTTEPTSPVSANPFDSDSISNYYDDSKGCWVITFDNAISQVGGYAFYKTNLTGMVIPEGVQTIGSTAFFGCMNLPTITLPRTLITIDEDAFNDSGLATITIPENVEYIGTWAFAFCDNLKEVFCKATTPPTLGATPFLQCPSNLQIYVPTESVDAYKSAEGWSSYADRIEGYNF